MLCFHKYGEILEKPFVGFYQVCGKCGKIKTISCPHAKWEMRDQSFEDPIWYSGTQKIKAYRARHILSKCTYCGKIKEEIFEN